MITRAISAFGVEHNNISKSSQSAAVKASRRVTALKSFRTSATGDAKVDRAKLADLMRKAPGNSGYVAQQLNGAAKYRKAIQTLSPVNYGSRFSTDTKSALRDARFKHSQNIKTAKYMNGRAK